MTTRKFPRWLHAPRFAALLTIAALVAAASLVSFAESYRGLWEWAREHGLSGVWAYAWPLQVDTFIAVGELALFVALVDAWAWRSRLGAWTVTLIGLAISVAGNVGHVTGHSPSVRATAAVPPLAAAAALAIGLGVLKRVVEHHPAPGGGAVSSSTREAAKTWFASTVAVGNPASINKIAEQFPMPRPAAAKLRREVLADVGGVPEPPLGGPAHQNGNRP